MQRCRAGCPPHLEWQEPTSWSLPSYPSITPPTPSQKEAGLLAGLPKRSALVGTRAHELLHARPPWSHVDQALKSGSIRPGSIAPPTSESRPAGATIHAQNSPAAGRYLVSVTGLFAATGRRGSTHLRTASAPIAPVIRSRSIPWSINTSVGMPRTPNLSCRPGSRSVFTLTAFSLPASSLESRSTAGATMRHGPHQGAQKSIRTGIGLLSTTEAKSDVPL